MALAPQLILPNLIFLPYADKRFGEIAKVLDPKGLPAAERNAMDY